MGPLESSLMNALKLGLSIGLAALMTSTAMAADAPEAPPPDWAGVRLYEARNAQLAPPQAGVPRVVLMGDSITEFWDKNSPLLQDKRVVNRGVSGQTTPQMLVRFRADVINLKPAVVLILAGTNDVAGNTGPITVPAIAGHIESMAELALAHGIVPVICAVVPANRYYWNPVLKPAQDLIALNGLLKAYAQRKNLIYVDYYSPMVDDQAGLKREYSGDGVHPNAAGYAVMAPLAAQAIEKALQLH